MVDIIVGGILLVVLAFAIRYIVRAKKAGAKCIGCSAGYHCSQRGKNGKCGCNIDFKE